jgi:hypothetical protein
MNLMRELDRMTQQTGASRVRTLSPEEVVGLERAGRITPVERIPESRAMTRVSTPKGFLEFIK